MLILACEKFSFSLRPFQNSQRVQKRRFDRTSEANSEKMFFWECSHVQKRSRKSQKKVLMRLGVKLLVLAVSLASHLETCFEFLSRADWLMQ